jgi:hypothetical protein
MTEIVEGWTAQPWTPGAGAGYERPNLRRRKSPAPEPPARKRKKMLKDKAQLRAPPPRRQQGQLGARHRRLPRPQTRQAPPTTSNGPRSPMASTRSPAPADPSAARSRNRLHPSEDTGQHVVGRQPLQERAGGDVDQGVALPKKERRRQRHGHRREEADQRDRTAKDEGSKSEPIVRRLLPNSPTTPGATGDRAGPPDRRQVADPPRRYRETRAPPRRRGRP